MLHSPGSKGQRICPPAIPEDVLAVLKLLSIDHVWDSRHRCYNLWRSEDNASNPGRIWYHVEWHNDWVPTLTEISDDIAAGRIRGVVSPGAIQALLASINESYPPMKTEGVHPWV